MEVIFKPKYPNEKCEECDAGKCKLPLIENNKYTVVKIVDNNYELMGWGTMKFNIDCFIKIDLNS